MYMFMYTVYCIIYIYCMYRVRIIGLIRIQFGAGYKSTSIQMNFTSRKEQKLKGTVSRDSYTLIFFSHT